MENYIRKEVFTREENAVQAAELRKKMKEQKKEYDVSTLSHLPSPAFIRALNEISNGDAIYVSRWHTLRCEQPKGQGWWG